MDTPGTPPAMGLLFDPAGFNPLPATLVRTIDGRECTFRLRTLRVDDAQRFDGLLRSISPATWRFWGADRLDKPIPLRNPDGTMRVHDGVVQTVAFSTQVVCQNIGADNTIRVVLEQLDQASSTFVGYNRISGQDAKSLFCYREHGRVELVSNSARVAPVLLESVRGCGLGTALMAYSLQLLAACGLGAATLHGGTDQPNHPAQRMYRATGFDYIGAFIDTDKPAQVHFDMAIADLPASLVSTNLPAYFPGFAGQASTLPAFGIDQDVEGRDFAAILSVLPDYPLPAQ